MRLFSRLVLVCALGACVPGGVDLALLAQGAAAQAPALIQTSNGQRQRYLANAVIWRPSGVPTPDQLREGVPGKSPLRGMEVDANGEVTCTYEKGGAGAPGRTAKFTCRTAAGRSLRVKYYDGNPQTGNREVFAEVIATRLFWALGFDADAVYPVLVRCLECPANPMTGQGPRESRRYLGLVEAMYEGTIITTHGDPNQGWLFRELRQAIATLPTGEHQARQQVYQDALALLSVFVQHGDRKPSQQRLVCRSPLDPAAGELQSVDNDDGFHLPIFVEHPDRRACQESVVTVQDLGATFGGAGQFTSNVGAKVHLASWAGTAMFAQRSLRDSRSGAAPPCRGNLAPSMSSGAEANPPIGNGGRRFLHERLSALTPTHIRAIFEAAHLDELKEPQQWRDRQTGQTLTGTDAWVAVFQRKVDEIGSTSCPN
jgi:hypothetical protein